MPRSAHLAHRLLLVLGIAATTWPLADRPHAAEPPPTAPPLPWQPDYAAAVARAQAAHQHIVVLLAAARDEACRRMETEILRADLIREALADMVWVRVENDAELDARLGAKVHPTLVFVNPFTGDVLHRVGGEKTVELLAREIIHARRAIGLALSPALEKVATRMFSWDETRAQQLLDAAALEQVVALLTPAAADDSRQANYLVATVRLPDGLTMEDVRFLAGGDCLVGSAAAAAGADAAVAARPPELSGACVQITLPPSGMALIPQGREETADLAVRITAPGCRLVDDTIRFAAPAPGTAVQVRSYELRRLTAAEAAVLSGRVHEPDGTPAADAIVRIDDWLDAADADGFAPAVARTDAEGRFTFPQVSPGRWLVRAEHPGGECERFVELEPGGQASCRLTLEAVTTVGLRWVLQTRELDQRLSAAGTRAGTAFFSVGSSRITLARGMRLRVDDACDLALAQTPLDDDSLPVETRRALADLPAGTPVWYLVDAAYTADFVPISGLHRDPRPFAAIETVAVDTPLPDQEWDIIGPILPQALTKAQERGGYFALLRGVPVRTGDVFTLRCSSSNCFAKLEVTDVTIVPREPRPRP